MPVNNDLLERSGDLKRALIEYTMQRRFDRAYRRALEQRFGRTPVVDEAELANVMDWFALTERLPDGRTPVEQFVAEHPELAEDERALLLGWRDVVEGIFEVKRREGEALVVVNLVDELTYQVYSNMGPALFRQTPRGSFLGGRIVPIGDDWMLSGYMTVLPAVGRAEIYRAASEFASVHPELVFRNPDKLARAWELQRQERQHFIAFFGADLVVLPGRDLAEQMRAYTAFRQDVRDEDGTSATDRARQAYGIEPPPVDVQIPDAFNEVETVGVIYDEVEGLAFLLDFGRVEAAFANPELAANRQHRQAVLGYLHEPSISPLPFRRLAERDPERASQLFQRILKRPGFSWERDGEALLQRHKASFFEQSALPGVVPLSAAQTRARLTTPASAPPRRDYRPARRGKQGRSR